MSENLNSLTLDLASRLASNGIYLDDSIITDIDLLLKHYIELHDIGFDNLSRLIDGFRPIIITHKTSEIDNCKYHSDHNSEIRCVLSYNWGKQKDWNTKGNTINATVFKYFSSSIITFINGLTDNSTLMTAITDIKKSNKLNIVNGRVKLTRISTKHQMKELMKLDTNEEQFDYLIASMNKEPTRIIEYLETVFTHDEITEIVVTAIKGKSKVSTILFRVPLVAQTIIRLFMENRDKTVWIWNNSQLIRLDLLQLISLYHEGLLHTRKEKIDSYIGGLSYKKGHLTQLPIFAFGLFLLSPEQIMEDIKQTNKTLPTLEQLDKSNQSAKLRIVDYKDSFMMTEKAINDYKTKVDIFYNLLRDYVEDNQDQIRVYEIDCKHNELNRSAKFNKVILKCKNYEVCNYSTK